MTQHAIELGVDARDRISGWEGVVVARYEYLNGCQRYEIGGVTREGKPEGFVFDAQQIEVLSEPRQELLGMPAPLPGHDQPVPGPYPDPTQTRVPGTSSEANRRAHQPGGPRGTAPVPR